MPRVLARLLSRRSAFVVAVGLALAGLASATTSPPARAAVTDTLVSGQRLAAGQSISSADGRFTTVMQGDGNLVEYGPSGPVWATGTGGAPQGTFAVLQGDGNLVLYSPNGNPLWASGTPYGAGDRLVIQGDGNLVVYSMNNIALWASRSGVTGNRQDVLPSGGSLTANRFIASADGKYKLILQPDGNLVEYGPSGALWASATTNGVTAAMQGDGNLVVYAAGAVPIWSSGTAGNTGARLVLQGDSNAVVIAASGTPLWASVFPVPVASSPQGKAVRLAEDNASGSACGANSLGGQGFGTSCTGNGGYPQYWCADFVKWIWANAGYSTAGLTALASSFDTYGPMQTKGYALKPGDAVTFILAGSSTVSHVGIVVSTDGTTATIENGDFKGKGATEAAFAGSSGVYTYQMPAVVSTGTATSFGASVYAAISPSK